MPQPQRDRYYQDWTPGDRVETGRTTLSRESVLAFAREYDPQPFHLDDDAAGGSLFGRLAASGWQTASATMRLTVDTGIFRFARAGLGVEQLRWHKPVYPEDTLHAVIECLDARTITDPRSGIVRFATTTFNQHDEKVMSHVASILIEKRASP